jgi:hypothetical protein
MGFNKVFTISALIVTLLVLPSSLSQAQQRGVPDSTCGRFQIFFNPNVRADTFLVDTQTGKVWRMTNYTDVPGSPTIWQYMERIDSREQLDKWIHLQLPSDFKPPVDLVPPIKLK